MTNTKEEEEDISFLSAFATKEEVMATMKKGVRAGDIVEGQRGTWRSSAVGADIFDSCFFNGTDPGSGAVEDPLGERRGL